MTKHTPGKMLVMNSHTPATYDLAIQRDDQGTDYIAEVHPYGGNQLDANRLALCWNTHDQLLEALKLAKSVLINPSQRTTDIIESAINAATQNPHNATKE